jgi:hypothetical protein
LSIGKILDSSPPFNPAKQKRGTAPYESCGQKTQKEGGTENR